MQKKKYSCGDIIFAGIFIAILVYLISIFILNITGRAGTNFDICSDAVLAKYIWETKTLFPKGWHFGNQIYTVATPVVAALFYGLVKDAYMALALASCLMTIAVLVSYVWCLKPFVNMRSVIISLLVLIGGTNISKTAHWDLMGLQIFYTMASYYACYLIGIFLTLGTYFRLVNRKKVHAVVQILVLLYNFALGMQSLREMLVLNLPLCAIIVFDMMLHCKEWKEHVKQARVAYMFGALALIMNAFGVMVTKAFVAKGIICQASIIEHVGTDYQKNLIEAKNAFLDYIGLHWPTKPFFLVSVVFLKFLVAIFSVIIIGWAIVCIAAEYRKSKRVNALGYCILFLVISLIAVLCAGTLVINVRDIYYFCWYSLVSASVVMVMEVQWKSKERMLYWIKNVLMLGLLGISVINYELTFYRSFTWIGSINDTYQEIAEQLQADGVQYLYSDWRTERNVLSVMSHDDIQYGTLVFSGNMDDLWDEMGYLSYEPWFEPENFEHAYIVLSNYAIYCLEAEFGWDYAHEFMSNLELVYKYEFQDEMIYFYKGSEKMFADMIQ